MIVCTVLAAAVSIAFEGVRNNDFVDYDDNVYVTENPLVQKGFSFESVKFAFTTYEGGYWHPLTWLSHIADCAMFGNKPGLHHLVSVGIHIANVILLFLILRMMTGTFWTSVFVAAIFGLHPLAVESVAWVAERKNVLSNFFVFLTIWAYFRYTQKPGLPRYFTVLILFASGILSKPMVVTLPFVLVLLDYWPINRFDGLKGWKWLRAALAGKIPLLVISGAWCVVTFIGQVKSGVVADTESVTLALRAGNALVSYSKYLMKIFYPVKLAILYPIEFQGPVLLPALFSATVLLTITAAVIWFGRKRGFLPTGWFWYCGTLVPVIGLVQVGVQGMADRYTYLPGVGIYIMTVWLLRDAVSKLKLPKVVPWVFALFLLTVLLLKTRTQVEYWKNSMSLFGHTAAVTKNNYKMHNNYGWELMKAGRPDEAILQYKRALEINPLFIKAHNNLGSAYREKGLFDDAAFEFEQAIVLDPNYAKAHCNYGILLAGQGLYDKAIEQFGRALEADPGFSAALDLLCQASVQSGKPEAALKVIEGLKQKTPDNTELYYRSGMLYAMQGNDKAVVEQLQKAIEMALEQGNSELAEQISGQLKLYQQAGQGK